MKDLTPGGDPDKLHNSVVTFPGQRQNSAGHYVEYHPIDASFVEEDEFSLKDIWHVLLRRRLVVLVFFLIAVSATTIATGRATPT